MKKLNLFVVALFVFSSTVFAQDKLLSLDDIFSPDAGKRVRFGGALPQMRWAADGKSFMQLVGGKLMRVDAVSGQSSLYYDAAKLSLALARVGVRADEADGIANSPFVNFSADGKSILLNNSNDLWLYDIATANLKRLTNNKAEELEEDLSPDGKFVSFVRGNNLFVIDIAKGNE